MESAKASALEAEAERLGLALLRFDYSGHGSSEGRLEDGTVSRWLEETLAVIRSETEGPQIVLGSSMGGYLALLAVRALSESGEAERLAGLILIAPAVDFTEALVWERAPEATRRAIIEDGAWRRPSAYSNEPDVFTRALIEDLPDSRVPARSSSRMATGRERNQQAGEERNPMPEIRNPASGFE